MRGRHAGKILSLILAPGIGGIMTVVVLRAAHLPLPPKLTLSEWPFWTIFAALAWMFNSGAQLLATLIAHMGTLKFGDAKRE